MLNKLIKKGASLLALLYCLAPWCNAKAQSSIADLQQTMGNIYKTYDSLSNITFDVKYTYASKSAVDSSNDALQGTYTMAGTKARYTLGDIEFMQNDSFLISVYNKDNYIIVSDPQNPQSGNLLPMRSVIDSILQSYSSHYTIGSSVTNGIGSISFNKLAGDSIAQYKSFTITYDSAFNVLQSVEYVFDELAQGDSTGQILSTKNLKIEFSNYRFDNFQESIYDENNYIFFEDGRWKPVSKYKDFRIFNSRAGIYINQQPS